MANRRQVLRLKCPQCPSETSKTFSGKHGLKQHMLDIHGPGTAIPTECVVCKEAFPSRAAFYRHLQVHISVVEGKDTSPDWQVSCKVCGSKPVVPITGMCGPCTFGEASTIGGNW